MVTLLVHQGSCNQVPQPGWCKKQPFTVSKVLGLTRLAVSADGREGDSVPRLSLPSGVCGILGFPWFVDPSLQSLPSSSLDVLPVSSSVPRFPPFIRTQPCWIKT